MNNIDSISLRDLERQLFKYEWQPSLQNVKERFVRDGVVNPVVWSQNLPARILILLKDPNGYTYWETKQWLEKEEFHHSKNHWKTWRLLAKCIHALNYYKLNNILKDYKSVQKAVSTPFAQYKQMQKTVVVNLKKQEGKSTISDNTLFEYFERYNKYFFIKQMQLYKDLDYIICGGEIIFDIITSNNCNVLKGIFKDKNIQTFNSPKCAIVENGPIILCCDHPAIRYSHELYYNRLIENLRFAETKR